MTRARARAAVLLATGPTAYSAHRFIDALATSLRANLLRLTGDPWRDLADLELDPTTYGRSRAIVGTAQDGTERLLLVLEPEPSATVHIDLLVATKGTTAATGNLLGQDGPEVGNSALVVRAFDTPIETAIAHDVVLITNQPANHRLKLLYSLMGFQGGRQLAVRSTPDLFDALTYIDDQYTRIAVEHPSFRRPW